MKIARSSLFTLALLVCGTAHSSQSLSSGLYLGGGVGYGQTALSRPAQVSTFKRNGFAWNVFAGYQYIPYLATEIGFTRMQNVKAAGIISGLSVRDTVEPLFIYLAMKGILPLRNHFALFSKLGGAYVYGKETLRVSGTTTVRSQNKIVPYGALGVSYTLSCGLSFDVAASTTLKKGMVPRLTTGMFNVSYYFY